MGKVVEGKTLDSGVQVDASMRMRTSTQTRDHVQTRLPARVLRGVTRKHNRTTTKTDPSFLSI